MLERMNYINPPVIIFSIIALLLLWTIIFRILQGKLLEKYAQTHGLTFSKKDIFNVGDKLVNFEPRDTSLASDGFLSDIGEKFCRFNRLKDFIVDENIYAFTGWKSTGAGARHGGNGDTQLCCMSFFEIKNPGELAFMRFFSKENDQYYKLNPVGLIPLTQIYKDDSGEFSANKLFEPVKQIISESGVNQNFIFCLKENKVLITLKPSMSGQLNNKMIDELFVVSKAFKNSLERDTM